METQHSETPAKPAFSMLALMKKYFGFIIVFLIIAVTSGVLLADHEIKSPASWDTYTSKEAGVSFKHPKSYKIVEDKGWRITVYTNPANNEDNLKIVYLPNDPDNSIESRFLATCQPARVNTIDANGTPIKIYEDSTCGEQKIDRAVMVNASNGMNYDITLFGNADTTRFYTFFSTFNFTTPALQTIPTQTPVPSLSSIPSRTPSGNLTCGTIAGLVCPEGYTCKLDGDFPDAGGSCIKDKVSRPSVSPKEEPGVMCTMDAKQCPDGSWVGRTGPKCEFVCP